MDLQGGNQNRSRQPGRGPLADGDRGPTGRSGRTSRDSADDQHRLNARQRREIDQIGQKFHFNLAAPPSSLDEITTGPKFVSPPDSIERFDWEYSDLDIVDRCEIKHLAAENFWRYIGKSEVPLEEPGHLSPVTVAKATEYGVNWPHYPHLG